LKEALDSLIEPLDILLPEQNFLHSVHLESAAIPSIILMLKKLGDLSKLDALKAVTIKHIHHAFQADWAMRYWPEMDTLLCRSLGVEVEEVDVGCSWYEDQAAAEKLRPWLPSLNERGILRVSRADTSRRHFSF
jgi:hypothetical protein